MNSIRVEAGKGYNVIFDKITSIEKYLKALNKQGKICIVCDKNVQKLHLVPLKGSIKNFEVFTFIIESGESSKSFANVEKMLSFLAENKFSRSDTLVALGGGVTGDLVGFVAGIYLRGIDFVQIPTTLLAAVDSSVGGKTGINLDSGKNLVGVFHQPVLVLCDVQTFETLPGVEMQNGYAEVIKYAFIANEKILEMNNIQEIVQECVKIKRDIVEADEFDTGIRQILNFGHTIGHAVEKCSNYTIPHGQAVAIGMQAIIKATNFQLLPALLYSYSKYNINGRCPFSAEQIYNAATNDKKIANGRINLITVPFELGRAEIYNYSFEELKKIIKLGIE